MRVQRVLNMPRLVVRRMKLSLLPSSPTSSISIPSDSPAKCAGAFKALAGRAGCALCPLGSFAAFAQANSRLMYSSCHRRDNPTSSATRWHFRYVSYQSCPSCSEASFSAKKLLHTIKSITTDIPRQTSACTECQSGSYASALASIGCIDCEPG